MAEARQFGPAARGGMLRELLADGPALFGVAVLVLLVLVAIFAPALAPYEPGAQSLRDRLLPPVWQEKGTWAHVLGTDHLGRDMLSRLIWGSRVSLTVGAAVVALAGAAGTAVGLVAGYCGGRVDAVADALRRHGAGVPGAACWRSSSSRWSGRRCGA